MSKLKELVNRGVRLIVTDQEAAEGDAPPAPAREREIDAAVLDVEPPQKVVRSNVPAAVESFLEVYDEAGITLPQHGYGIDKVGEMLANKRLAALAREARASAVMVALDAAGAPIRDVIQDAVKRDRALDAFEAGKAAEVEELRGKSEARVQAIKQEIEAFLKERNAEIDSLKLAADAAEQAFVKLQERKRREEERLHGIVSHFIEGGDNPITAAAADKSAAAAPPPKTSA